jgi:hypothetical protein
MNTPSVPPATTTSYIQLPPLLLVVVVLLLLLLDLTDLLGSVLTNCGAGPAAAPVCKHVAHTANAEAQLYCKAFELRVGAAVQTTAGRYTLIFLRCWVPQAACMPIGSCAHDDQH